MSKVIDENVVEMRFDNRQFESNVQTSMNTLDKLKQSLDMKGAADGFQSIEAASNKVNFSGLSGAVESVKERFSAFEVMAVTALANITNSAVNAGKQLLYSLAIEPRKQGFEEYELKMGSIQTIMASTGESLETVNKYLEDLNTYSDKTIYSFSDMTANIGKFTNAGVDLKDAVKAIQGISNEAAISGANASEASRAMYNFAQALSAGSVKLIDWKSIENANMATVDFKNNLIKTALELGTLRKEGDKYVSTTTNIQGKTSDAFDATSMFNESLNHQWMTSEVLIKTLGEYSDETTELGKKAFAAAQDVKTFSQLMDTLKEAVGSGWSQTFEIIFGDFEEAKKLWTSVSNVVGDFIGKTADARNELLKGWKELGGRTALIDAFKNAFEGLKSVITPVVEAFKEIFPPVTAKHLMHITENLKAFTSRLKLSEEASKNLKNTFKGLFAALDIVKQLFSAILKPIKSLLGMLGGKGSGLVGRILEATGSFGEWIVKLDETIKKNDTFNKSVQKVVDFIKKCIDSFKTFAETLRQKLHIPDLETVKKNLTDFMHKAGEKIKTPGLDLLHAVLKRIGDILIKIGDIFVKIKNKIVGTLSALGEAINKSGLSKVLEALWKMTKRIAKGISSVLGGLIHTIIEKLGSADFQGVIHTINGIFAGGALLSIRKFFKTFTDSVSGLGDIFSNVTGILNGVKGCLEAYQQQLKANVLLKIAIAIGILAGSILVLSLIDSEKLGVALGAMTALFTELMTSLALFSRLSGGIKNTSKVAGAMIAMSISLLLLASACKKLSKLNWEELAKGLTGVGVLMLELSYFIRSIGKTKGLLKASTSMIAIGVGLKIIASACKSLGSIDIIDLIKGLAAIEAIFLEVASFAKLTKNAKGMIKNGTALIIIGAGLKVIASACKSFGSIDLVTLVKGLAAIEIIFLEVASFGKLTSNTKKILKSSLALITIGLGLKVLASACKDLGSIDLVTLVKGLAAIEIIFLEVASFAKLTSKSKNLIKLSLSLIAIGAGLKVIASACKSFGEMGVKELAKALISIEIIFLEIASFVGLIGNAKGVIKTAAALSAFGIGLKIMASACKQFGALSWEELLKALASIAGIIITVGIAGKVLAPVTKNILALGAALGVVGLGIMAIGAGLVLIGLGIQAISVGFSLLGTSVAVNASAITAAITVIIMAVADLIPAIIRKIGEGLVEFCKVISDGAPAIGLAIKNVILTLVDLMTECIPPLVDGLLQMIDSLLKSLVEYAPSIIDSVLQFIILLLDGIAKRMPELLKSALRVVGSFFVGLVDAIKEMDTSTLEKAILGVGLIAGLMKLFASIVPSIPQALVGIAGVGAAIGEIGGIMAAIGALQQIPGLNWLVNEGGKLLEAIGTAIGSFIGGFVGGIMRGITDQLPAMGTNLSLFMTNLKPFIEEAVKLDAKALEGVRSLAEIILILTASEVLNGIASWLTGGNSLASFAGEIALLGPGIKAFSDSIQGIDADAIQNAATAAGALAALENGLKDHGGVFGWFKGDSNLGDFGKNLKILGPAIKKYSDSIKGIKPKAVEASAAAAGTLAALEKNLKDHGGVFGWFKGDSDLSGFGESLNTLGPAMKNYSDSVQGIKPEAVEASALAAKSLAELENNLKDHKGVFQWFKGDSDLKSFAEGVTDFGKAMSEYAKSIGDNFPSGAVVASANSAEALATLENNLKDHGGVFRWFTGDSDLKSFGEGIVEFGKAMSQYANSIGENFPSEAVVASANSAEALATLENNLKDHHGVFQFFSGDSDLTSFATGIIAFGMAMSQYANSIGDDFPTEAVTASANAAQTLAELENHLKDHGGVFQLFEGDSDLGSFAIGIVKFGVAMKSYGESIGDEFPAGAVVSSANAAKSLAELEKELKNHGGIFQIFAGDNDLGNFAKGIAPFGEAMASYGESIGENFPEAAVVSSARAGKALAELEKGLKNHGGVFQLFTGDNDLENFSKGIAPFGTAMKSYADSLGTEKFPEEAVVSSANAGKALAELESGLKNHGGVFQLFTGDNDLENFSKGIAPFGTAMKSYADSLGKDKFPEEAVVSSANAAKALAELESGLKNHGGVFQIITGDSDIKSFGEGLKEFGPALKEYGDSIDGLKADVITNSANAAKALAEISNILPSVGGIGSWFSGNKQSLEDFGNNISRLGDGIHGFYTAIFADNAEHIAAVVATVTDIADMGEVLSKMDVTIFAKFGNSLKEMAKNGVHGFTEGFVDAEPRMHETVKLFLDDFEGRIKKKKNDIYTAFNIIVNAIIDAIEKLQGSFNDEGEELIQCLIFGMKTQFYNAEEAGRLFVWKAMEPIEDALDNFADLGNDIIGELESGMKSQKQTVVIFIGDLMAAMLQKAKSYYNQFGQAGEHLVTGFAKGIENNAALANNASAKMAQTAADAAAKTLQEHSPSKVGYEIGDYFGIGFINAIDDQTEQSYSAGEGIAESAKTGLGSALYRLSDMIENGIDTQPTIRPVLDLSDVSRGMSEMNAMFSSGRTVELAAITGGSVNSGRYGGQINVNNADVIAELNRLRGDVSALSNTIAGMKVVMDTGALVGAIASPMDYALGRQSVYQRRGN